MIKINGLTKAEFDEVIVLSVEHFGSRAAAARAWGVSPQYVGDVLSGKRKPGPKILKAFGLRPLVVYEQIERV